MVLDWCLVRVRLVLCWWSTPPNTDVELGLRLRALKAHLRDSSKDARVRLLEGRPHIEFAYIPSRSPSIRSRPRGKASSRPSLHSQRWGRTPRATRPRDGAAVARLGSGGIGKSVEETEAPRSGTPQPMPGSQATGGHGQRTRWRRSDSAVGESEPAVGEEEGEEGRGGIPLRVPQQLGASHEKRSFLAGFIRRVPQKG